MAFGNGDEVLVRINGDNRGAINAIRGTSDELTHFGGSAQGVQFNLSSLGQEIFRSMGSFGAFALTANSVLGVVGEIGSAVGSVIGTFTSLADTIVNVVVGALRMAADEIGNLTQQVFELNKSTEQNTGSWLYIYGHGNDPQGHGRAITQGLMDWTSTFSMDVPYTRQDLMGAITALGRTGMSDKQVEQYMSTIADLGALNPQRTLTQAAWSVQGAMSGYSRMLKYDYGINPDELAQFGYDVDNPQATLLPALQAYLSARHMTGAALYAAKHTFWGAESSFVDRLQNFGLQVGGTDLNGAINNGSMFGVMKDDLVGISKWWDDHSKDINALANLFKNVLGGAVKDLTAIFQGLAEGIHKSGLDTLFEQMLSGFGKWLNDPATTANLKRFADAFGQLGGTAVSTALQAAGTFFQGLASTGVPQALFNGLINLFTNIGTFFKDHKQDINEFFYELGKVSGKAMQDVAQGFKDVGAAFERMKANMSPQDWYNLKWFISDNTIGIIGRLGVVFKTLADVLAGMLITLTEIEKAWGWLEQHGWIPSGAWASGAAGAGGGGSGSEDKGSGSEDKGGGTKAHLSYNTASTTSMHFYGANTAQVAQVTNRLLDERDRGSYMARRTPGGFSSLGILGY